MPATQYLGGVGGAGAGQIAAGSADDKIIDDHLAVQAIIRSYQVIFFPI